MVRKKIDNRLRVMIENGVALGHRTMFVVVGDKGRDQVKIEATKILKTDSIQFNASSSRQSKVCIFINVVLFSGRHPPPHVKQGRRQGASLCSLVLQEGARIFESSSEKDEKFAEKN